jgi:hypothetical protein
MRMFGAIIVAMLVLYLADSYLDDGRVTDGFMQMARSIIGR